MWHRGSILGVPPCPGCLISGVTDGSSTCSVPHMGPVAPPRLPLPWSPCCGGGRCEKPGLGGGGPPGVLGPSSPACCLGSDSGGRKWAGCGGTGCVGTLAPRAKPAAGTGEEPSPPAATSVTSVPGIGTPRHPRVGAVFRTRGWPGQQAGRGVPESEAISFLLRSHLAGLPGGRATRSCADTHVSRRSTARTW